MNEVLPSISDDVLALILREDEVVPAAAIAPILKMHPAAMIWQAKNGLWDRQICNYVISGNRVKFFRLDFLRKGGWIQ